MATIAVVDYGMGNLRSVAKALERVAPSQRVVISQRGEEILAADRVVLPGQGAMGACMAALRAGELVEPILAAAKTKPFLGICLGPQALLDFSEENQGIKCLGVLPGRVCHFAGRLDHGYSDLKIPHMGWNQVRQSPHPLWDGIGSESWFYFVHSFYLSPSDPDLVAGTAHYGFDFAAAIARDNIFAVQFHPEKSAQAGLRLLANFSGWAP